MTQTQNRQEQAHNLDAPTMNVWRLNRRLSKKHEKEVHREIQRRMTH